MPRPDFKTPRLFVTGPLEASVSITLERDQANYLCNVLRLREGDRVLLFNGREGEWRADVAATSKRGADLVVREQSRAQPPSGRITYAFAPLKHARLDYVVQKAVEMGAAVLQPVVTRRTQISRINHDRMRANVIEAAEQCGVLAVPDVGEELRFDAWLERWPAEAPIVFCDEDAESTNPLEALGALGHQALALLIGPEGGFDPAERAALLARPSTIRISLGPRILRADTAAVAALALIQAMCGDWH